MKYFFFLCAWFPLFLIAQDCQEQYDCWRKKGIELFQQKEYETAMAAFKMAGRSKDLPATNDLNQWNEKCRQQRKVLAQMQPISLAKNNVMKTRSMEENPTETQPHQLLKFFIEGDYEAAWKEVLNDQSTLPANEKNKWLERALYGKSANRLFYKGDLDSAKQLYQRIQSPYPDDFATQQLEEIAHIELAWKPITEVRPDTLLLNEMDLYALPQAIGDQTQLKFLDVSNNFLSALPPQMSRLDALRQLNLSRNDFRSLPAILLELPTLESCDFSDNEIEKIESLPYNKVLKVLNLSRNHLTYIAPMLNRFSQLQELDLHQNRLANFNAEITELSQLKILDISNNNIHELPISISKLRNLRELDISGNGYFSFLPKEIGGLTQLVELNMGKNEFLSPLPTSFGQLFSLEKLRLNSCNLAELPIAVGQMTLLTHLDLEGNLLSKLPSSVGNWKNMEALDLRNNHLYELPVEIGKLSQLQELNLSGNLLLNRLPEEIKYLKNLKELDLRNTGIRGFELRKIRARLPDECEVLSD